MIFTSTSYTACFSFHGNQTNKPLYSYKKSRKSPYNLQSLHTVTLTLALKSPKQGKKKEEKKKVTFKSPSVQHNSPNPNPKISTAR